MVPRDVMLRGLSLIHSSGMLSNTEAEFLYDTAAGLPGFSLWAELGVWCGRSFWAAACGLPVGSRIVGADLFSGQVPIREGSNVIQQLAPTGDMQERLATAVVHSVYELRKDMNSPLSSCGVHKMDSVKFASLVDSVDVLVVDAAHDYDSVKADLAAWVPKMKPGGTLIGHDYGGKFLGVTRAFDERFGGKCQQVPGTRFVKVQL